MGDHFALLVDHLLTESTLEAAIANSKVNRKSSQVGDCGAECSPRRQTVEWNSLGKLVECRICHEEGEDCSMEIPCSCCGSLKYAHRNCIQRWCNEKGDTMCEICLQQFRPGYTAPEKLCQYGIPLNFRGSWQISREDLNGSEIIRMVQTNRDLLDFDDIDYSASSIRGTYCCRSVAVIFLVLLTLRHTLPLLTREDSQYSFITFSVLALKTVGVLVPILVIAKALTIFYRRRHQQRVREISVSSSSGGDQIRSSYLRSTQQPQPYQIQV